MIYLAGCRHRTINNGLSKSPITFLDARFTKTIFGVMLSICSSSGSNMQLTVDSLSRVHSNSGWAAGRWLSASRCGSGSNTDA
jgi:hypothetical protein